MFGPEAVRSASALLPPYRYRHRVDIFAELACVDAGDLPVAPGDTLETFRRAEESSVRSRPMELFRWESVAITPSPWRSSACDAN